MDKSNSIITASEVLASQAEWKAAWNRVAAEALPMVVSPFVASIMRSVGCDMDRVVVNQPITEKESV